MDRGMRRRNGYDKKEGLIKYDESSIDNAGKKILYLL